MPHSMNKKVIFRQAQSALGKSARRFLLSAADVLSQTRHLHGNTRDDSTATPATTDPTNRTPTTGRASPAAPSTADDEL